MNIPFIHYLLFAILFILIIGLIYLILKKQASTTFQYLNENLEQLKSENALLKKNNIELDQSNRQLSLEVNSLQSENRNLNILNSQLNTEIKDLNNKILNIDYQYNKLKISFSEQKTENKNLLEKLGEERLKIEALNEKFKKEFENLANKILEEKSHRFAIQNKENLDLILKPFQDKINEFKQTVHETYEKENKQRFSLGEKVKELAALNQQISEDAKKLTKALKSESKTQGNWGEMILENILEKSGLVKGREYFMEYQLKDEDNKALFSEFSGKKMRPDAVVKYPDNRNVIIDSKVSLTAFLDTIDELDDEILEIKLNQHLKSIKNHINQLSQKAYDDYSKSLDFVMMFIPSESAYIAAMQKDPNLWEYAYDKRILLLNPSNLITSLKLLADLWKRDYQNKNALEIAHRGAKLYDKFVGFISNLEEVGKQLNRAHASYEQAYKQLHTGRDNLVNQSQKLKNLGIKSKKTISPTLIQSAKINSQEKE
ncbi:DNA recombination protein RmuC [Flavobacteriaceae bacterium Ap0902]|nr:DNA recombination protein RmuC [Flavobacteriaceae bacterium Ap0902]